MKRKVGVIGISQTKHEGAKRGQDLVDMIFETTRGALDDAGMEIGEIDSVVLAAHDLIDGRSISSMLLAAPAGAHMKEETRVADDGAFAVALAWMRLMSGEFGTSLVVSWSKLSEGNFDAITQLNFDPVFYRPVGLNHLTAHALQAMSYSSRYGVTEAQAAGVTVKNRSNALDNPLAHLRQKVTMDEVLRSPLLAWPLKELDMPPRSDGACALVLASEKRAKKAKNGCAWIRGIGWGNDTYYLGDKDLAGMPSLTLAANKAFKMAKVNDPLKQLDVAELHDVSSYHELMAYEALGLCKPGEGHRLVDEGTTSPKGELPVNPSGGALSSNPYTAVGLVRVAEAALQVMGRAGAHQVPGAKAALAHGTSGMCGQSNCVVIVGS
ncbi:MAG: thiolase family protein [Chloroflexi bacterium]|nr:thiolase family protein [Chloroflexota bacterium]